MYSQARVRKSAGLRIINLLDFLKHAAKEWKRQDPSFGALPLVRPIVDKKAEDLVSSTSTFCSSTVSMSEMAPSSAAAESVVSAAAVRLLADLRSTVTVISRLRSEGVAAESEGA